MSAMVQGLFYTLLIGIILNTLGAQFKIGFLTRTIVTIASAPYTIGGLEALLSFFYENYEIFY